MKLHLNNLCLFLAFFRYLNWVHHIELASKQYLHCQISMTSLNSSSTTSTLIILFMTFECFYSIVWPHRAASFSTTRRAKATILCCCTVNIIYSIPHVFTTHSIGRQCIPLGNASQTLYGQIYYWLNFFANFTAPFVILLVMNSVIIHKLSRRSDLN